MNQTHRIHGAGIFTYLFIIKNNHSCILGHSLYFQGVFLPQEWLKAELDASRPLKLVEATWYLNSSDQLEKHMKGSIFLFPFWMFCVVVVVVVFFC